MTTTQKKQTSRRLADLVVRGMQDKKASRITILDLRHVGNAVADFFVICSGNSDTQVDAISDAVRETVYENLREQPWHVEGKTNREWVLIDYADTVVHIFRKDRRQFYDLEHLWGDAGVTHVESE